MLTDAHPCENEGQQEDEVRAEDEEEVDGGVLDDRFDDVRSCHGQRAGV